MGIGGRGGLTHTVCGAQCDAEARQGEKTPWVWRLKGP